MPLTSYYTALTGLNNNSTAINVIGDNLANINTTAFKSAEVKFAELLAGSTGTDPSGNPIATGLGSMVNSIVHNNTGGTINFTGRDTDVAINGNGFFLVSNHGEMAYTRNGSFTFSSEGTLTSADGMPVMGYMAENGEVNPASPIVPIVVPKGQVIPGAQTTYASIRANLDAQSVIGESFPAIIQVFDSIGGTHSVTMNYTRTGSGTWDWNATIPAESITGGVAGDPPVSIGSGAMEFDGNGVLISPALNPTLSMANLANGANNMDFEMRFMEEDGTSILTSYVRESAVSNSVQNGYGASAISKISIDNTGMLIGQSEGGTSINLAQLALADFPNVEGLQKFKGSTFLAFGSAGAPSIGIAGMGGRGNMVGASLEQSNVDMAQEFVRLIQAQRAYQANTRIISTTDELTQAAINLK